MSYIKKIPSFFVLNLLPASFIQYSLLLALEEENNNFLFTISILPWFYRQLHHTVLSHLSLRLKTPMLLYSYHPQPCLVCKFFHTVGYPAALCCTFSVLLCPCGASGIQIEKSYTMCLCHWFIQWHHDMFSYSIAVLFLISRVHLISTSE